MPPKQISLPIGAHQVAANQAHGLSEQAVRAAKSFGAKVDAGDALAYLVTAALAIELYIKAIMILGRRGLLTTGHDLGVLISEFPPELMVPLRDAYDTHPTAKTAQIRLIALRLTSQATPAPPAHNGMQGRSYASFDDAIRALADVFVRARYFFEELAGADWAVFDIPADAIEGVLLALERVYMDLRANKLLVSP